MQSAAQCWTVELMIGFLLGLAMTAVGDSKQEFINIRDWRRSAEVGAFTKLYMLYRRPCGDYFSACGECSFEVGARHCSCRRTASKGSNPTEFGRLTSQPASIGAAGPRGGCVVERTTGR